jgi:hypothetical protein
MGGCLSKPAAEPAPAPPVAPPAAPPPPPVEAPLAASAEQQQQQQAQVTQFPVMAVTDAPVRPPWASRAPGDAMPDGSIPPPMGVRQQGRSTTAEAVRMNLSEVRRKSRRRGGALSASIARARVPRSSATLESTRAVSSSNSCCCPLPPRARASHCVPS